MIPDAIAWWNTLSRVGKRGVIPVDTRVKYADNHAFSAAGRKSCISLLEDVRAEPGRPRIRVQFLNLVQRHRLDPQHFTQGAGFRHA